MAEKKYIYDYNINDFVHTLNEYINKKPKSKQTVIMCIGTDKATGDLLGPLVGSILEKQNIPHLYGTMKKPVHALNLEKTVKHIYSYYASPFILAVDASLGMSSHIGAINIWEGALAPGSGISKALVNVGDISVTGIVNSYYGNGYYQLQSSKLSVVMDMAYLIGKGISKVLG